MTRQFTSQDADRLLQLGDQFLEDWEQSALESADESDYAEFQERHDEWTAIRPLLAAAPLMRDALQMACNFYSDGYDEDDATERRVMSRIVAALAAARKPQRRTKSRVRRPSQMSLKECRAWLAEHDPAGEKYWRAQPLTAALRAAVQDNLRDFGPYIWNGSLYKADMEGAA
jgi:hypothetical protein